MLQNHTLKLHCGFFWDQ